MDFSRTALVLIGFQNDYFADDGILRAFLDESVDDVRDRALALVGAMKALGAEVISTPIMFTPGYEELVDPVGILAAIRDHGAFRQGTAGCEPIAELADLGSTIRTIPGKRGLNAFSNTELDQVLRDGGVEHVMLAGAVTSICIDSTGRSAHERGFSVSVVSDCVVGRSPEENEFYMERIFPLYANVLFSDELLAAARKAS